MKLCLKFQFQFADAKKMNKTYQLLYILYIDSRPNPSPAGAAVAAASLMAARHAGRDLTKDSSSSIQLHFPHSSKPLSNNIPAAMFKNETVVKNSSASATSTSSLPIKTNQGIVFYQVKRDKVFDPTKIDWSSLSLPSLMKHSENKSK